MIFTAYRNELTPEVEDKDVTVRRADLTREIKSLLSYAVGCLFGRYSLDVDGLVYAGGEWDASKYVTLQPVKDNVLPLCDEEYFEDNDLVNRIVEFVRCGLWCRYAGRKPCLYRQGTGQQGQHQP